MDCRRLERADEECIDDDQASGVSGVAIRILSREDGAVFISRVLDWSQNGVDCARQAARPRWPTAKSGTKVADRSILSNFTAAVSSIGHFRELRPGLCIG